MAHDADEEGCMQTAAQSETDQIGHQDRHGSRSGWRFLHPPRGTCFPGCPSYETCHCGCGGHPKLSRVTHERSGRWAGHPFTFVSGHQIRVAHPRAGIWSRNGVPVERVRPLVFWLRDQLGSIRTVAMMLQMPEATVRGYAYNTKRKRVPPLAAGKIARLVLAHRKPTGPLDLWEEQPGMRPSPNILPMRQPQVRQTTLSGRNAR
jgi:hypothetical protein